MEQEKSAFKMPPPETLKAEKERAAQPEEKEVKREAQKKEATAQALSGLWDQIAKEKSFMDKILNFVSHPFVLLGGLIVTVFFLTRGKQDNSRPETPPNAELLHKIKKLKKKNKKLRAMVESLSGNNADQESQLSLPKIPLQLPPPDSKPQTFYLD